MSDPLHLDKVRAGAVVWNTWRRDNPNIVPDLNGLRISASELQFGVVQGGPVDFSRTELSQAVLVHATLIEANLAGALLTKADLSYARLNKADLRGADLRGAKLAYADLTDARFDGAFVCGADLRHSRGLTQQQIERALGGDHTLLPAGLQSPATWLAEEERERQRGQAQDIDALTKAYDLLGVKPKASMQEIRTAWLRLVKELHPDIAADDPSGSERLKAINRAYQGLKSLEQREIARRAQRRPSSGAATFAVFLFLPIAATAAMAVWTHGLPVGLLRGVPVAAVTEPRANTEEVALAATSGQTEDANETHAALGVGYQPHQPQRSGEVGALASAVAERSDSTSGVEVALGSDHGARDSAATQQATPVLHRNVLEYPKEPLAEETRAKLAAIEAEARADVASSGTEQKDTKTAPAGDVAVHTATDSPAQPGRQDIALAEITERESTRDPIAGAELPRINAEHAEQADLSTHLEPRPNGRHAEPKLTELESILEAKPAATANTKHARQVMRTTGRPGVSAAHQARSPSEPFVGADGRIR